MVVLQGAGPSFSAGIDLRLFSAEGVPGEEPLPSPASPGFEEWIASCQEGYRWLRDPSIVSVAAVRGHAIGAGFQLALACDLRVLADDARLCMKEPLLGLVPDLTGTKPLVDLVGLPRALELCLTGRTLDRGAGRRAAAGRAGGPGRRARRRGRGPGGALLAVEAPVARATKELLQQAPHAPAAAWMSRRPRNAAPRPPCSGPGSGRLARPGRPPGPAPFALG